MTTSKQLTRFKISHISFCLIYTTLVYVIYNALNFNKLSKWFYIKDRLDYAGLTAFLILGLCVFIVIFTLLAHRRTIKPLAIILTTLGGIGVYFTSKYNVAIDRGMIMNAVHTDITEVNSLLSVHMIPYFLFFIALPAAIISRVQITFDRPAKYLLVSAKTCAITLVVGISLIYAQFNNIARAANLSKKYIIFTLVPINFLQSFGSIIQNSAKSLSSKHAKEINVSGRITAQDNLVVVLAVGETSRQQNFSLYGYKRQNTNPVLSKDKNLHLLNGVARLGSTLYALPEILAKNDVPLAAITSKLGINTSCYVNYTLYGLCNSVGETEVKNCGHDGTCYDEDVLPLLSENLKTYNSGYRLVILHLGGGSHGPSYHERYPAEFQQFKPMCFDADVVNHCTLEELYNSYDNTILYVDHVLGKITNKLDESKVPYVFIYLSDHGESLMENDRIFHGMPPGIALPYEQAHIPLIVKSSLPISVVKREEYGQQDVFDTVLELFSIETEVHNKDRSFIKKQK